MNVAFLPSLDRELSSGHYYKPEYHEWDDLLVEEISVTFAIFIEALESKVTGMHCVTHKVNASECGEYLESNLYVEKEKCDRDALIEVPLHVV